MHFVFIAAIFFRRTNSPVPFFFWSAIGMGAGLYLFIRGFQLLQRRRVLMETPLSKIRSASIGLVEVTGLATGPYVMPAPISGHPCYYYRTLVWEYRQQGKNKQWVKIVGDCQHLPFFLDDNTGRVLVDPHGAELDIHRDFQQEFCDGFFTTKEPAPPNVRAFLQQHGVSTRNKIKVEEFCIKPKNALFILGTLSDNDAVDVNEKPISEDEPLGTSAGSLRMMLTLPLPGIETSFSSTILTRAASAGAEQTSAMALTALQTTHAVVANAAGPADKAKIINALMRAGITNPAAWEAAGVAPARVTASPGWNDPSGGSRPPVVLRKGEHNSTFLISWRSREAIAQTLAWKCTAMIWGGPAIFLGALYVFVNLMHIF